MKFMFCFLIVFLLMTNLSISQNFILSDSSTFIPQNKKVLLFDDSTNNKKIVMFKTILNVNTDGTPISYHPFDLRGKSIAINTIGNAIAVYGIDSTKNLCLDISTYQEAISIIEKFRDSNYEDIPAGYKISWKNVLASEIINGKEKPCIFKSGEYKGYYGSLTSLKNDLVDKGECECNDQVNPLEVPTFVLVGGKDNILRRFGADTGDLIVAYNPKNMNMVYGIISDIGPKDKLGEGSVLLNMKLLNLTEFPKNKKDTYENFTPKNEIVIAIIPKSNDYSLTKPFTIENINERTEKWIEESGFKAKNDFIDFLKSNFSNLH